MDALIFLLQLACGGALAYGGWICLKEAGKYDAHTARSDEAASLRARSRAQRMPASASAIRLSS
jgi:hypothetical protein